MKNKEIIKKSIEQNIVDHAAVLNNMKAKAMTTESEKTEQKPLARIGFRRAALIFTMFILIVTMIVCVSSLYNHEDSIIPPSLSSSADNGDSITEESAVSSYSDIISPESLDSSELSEVSTDETSREPSGNDESNVPETPLNIAESIFFIDFSNKFITFQNIIYGQIEYDKNNIKENYAPVSDENIHSLKDIKVFLDSYLAKTLSGEIYNSLISGDAPIYKESDNKLYIKIDCTEPKIHNILVKTAVCADETEKTLKVKAMIDSAEYNYSYYCYFNFEKNKDGEWRYVYDLSEYEFFLSENESF